MPEHSPAKRHLFRDLHSDSVQEETPRDLAAPVVHALFFGNEISINGNGHLASSLLPRSLGFTVALGGCLADGGHDRFGEGGQVGRGLFRGQVAEGEGSLEVVDRRLPDLIDQQVADRLRGSNQSGAPR